MEAGDSIILQISFTPLDKDILEIERWLLAENEKTGKGFYCNLSSIKSSYGKNELVIISSNDKPIGFATWRHITEKTAEIVIAEVELNYRGKGIGKKLVTELLKFLNDKGIWVVHLQCAPEESEPIWKALGFLEFPDPLENYNFNTGGNKKLFKILNTYLATSSGQFGNVTIELWNDEPHTTDDTIPSYTWSVIILDGTGKLATPIIHPGHHQWRLRWRINGKTIKDSKVNRFPIEIDFENFIIIHELPVKKNELIEIRKPDL